MSKKTRTKNQRVNSTVNTEDLEEDDEYVTFKAVREMLLIQERMFKSFIDSILSEQTKRVDGLVKDIAEFKSSLQYSQKDIEDNKKKIDTLEIGVHAAINDIKELQADGEKQLNKSTYLENQSRRNNLRIDGIKEESKETWEDTEQKVKATFMDKLNLDYTPEIERAHRTGRRFSAAG